MASPVKLTELVEPAQLRELSKKSDALPLIHLAGRVLALVGSAYLISSTMDTWWVLAALTIHGVQLAFLFALHHECIHLTAFRSKWINHAVNWFLGALLFYPPEYFRAFHMTHHRHTQDPERDPELGAPMPRSKLQYAWRILGLGYWRRRIGEIFSHALTGRVPQRFVPERSREMIVRQARILLSFYAAAALASIALSTWAPIMYWLGPLLLGQPFLMMYQLAEHGGTDHSDDAFRNTRTTLTTAFVRWLAWNMPYHTEHHLFPGVPFYKLPLLHRRIQARLQIIGNGYVAVNWEIYRNLPIENSQGIPVAKGGRND